MKIGDIVSRKKYHQDIIFEVIDIQENICYLRGIEYRLIADSEIDDLELVQDKRVIEDVHLPQEKCLKGSVLHLSCVTLRSQFAILSAFVICEWPQKVIKQNNKNAWKTRKFFI